MTSLVVASDQLGTATGRIKMVAWMRGYDEGHMVVNLVGDPRAVVYTIDVGDVVEEMGVDQVTEGMSVVIEGYWNGGMKVVAIRGGGLETDGLGDLNVLREMGDLPQKE